MPIAVAPPAHPHLPPPLGQLSPWQRSTRDHPLLNANATTALPEAADVAIIGSGMCGAVLANSLLKHAQRPARVVCLEAREICSGASGRNAGHCRPDLHRGFTTFSKFHGAAEARKICESEQLVWDRVDGYVRDKTVSCEWTPRPTVDVALSSEFAEYSDAALRGIKEEGANPPVVRREGTEAHEESRTASAQATYTWRAASLNPAQLTLHVHTENLGLGGYSLHAWAPVHSVKPSASPSHPWTVNTPRGSVDARTVVYATNAYTDALLPELTGLIVPTRAQGIHLAPSPAALAPFEPTMSFRYQMKHFYSLATRPDHSVVLGTSRTWPGIDPAVQASMVNTVDDSVHSAAVTRNAMEAFCGLFPDGGWGTEGLGEGKEGEATAEGYKYSWTGIIGMTPDAVPLVGAVPGKEGQFCAAGYNGHGMARIFLCAPSLAHFILEGRWPEEMPRSFVLSQERIDRLQSLAQGTKKVEIAQLDTAQPALYTSV